MLNAVSGEEDKFKREAVSALQGIKRTSCASSEVSKKGNTFKYAAFARTMYLLFI